MRDVLNAIQSAPANTTSAKLHRLLPPHLKGNKAERDTLVAILGLCGVLGSTAHPGYRKSFVQYIDREDPPRHFVDMAYPASWWKRSDGLDEASLHEFFGHLL